MHLTDWFRHVLSFSSAAGTRSARRRKTSSRALATNIQGLEDRVLLATTAFVPPEPSETALALLTAGNNTDGTPNPANAGPMLQTGFVTGVGSDGWSTVTLDRSYQSMVVVATPNYDAQSAPGVARIRNESGNSFQVKMDRAGGGSLSDVDVHFLVVEEGNYLEALHGITMEAVKFTSTITDSASSWSGQNRSYANSYATPVVLGQVMSANDPDFSVFWSRAGGSRENAPNGESMRVGKHVGEDTDRSRAAETIGYVVIEAGSGTIDGRAYVARRGTDTIRGVDDPSRPDSYLLRGLPTAVTAVASQTGMDGANGGWAVLYGENPVSATRLNLAIDEDQAKDAERIHTSEQVAYFVMEAQETSVEQFGVSIDNTPAQNSAALQLAIDSAAADGKMLQFHGDYTFAANSPAARVANGSSIHDGVAAAIIAPNTKIDFNSHTQTVVLTEPVTVARIYFLSGSETQPADDISFKNGFISDGTTGSPLNTKHAPMIMFNLIESDGIEILNVYGGANKPRALLTSAGSHNGVIQLDNPLQMKLGWFAFSEQWTVSDLVFTNASSRDELIDLDAGNNEMSFGTIVVTDDAKLLREVVDINGSSNINIQSIETDGARAVLIASKATYANFAQYKAALAGRPYIIAQFGLPVSDIHIERIVVNGDGGTTNDAIVVGNSRSQASLVSPKNISFGSISAVNVSRGMLIREAENLTVGSLKVRNAVKGLLISVHHGPESTFTGSFGTVDIKNTRKEAIELQGVESVEIDTVKIRNANLDGTDDRPIRFKNRKERNSVILLHDVDIL